jgi:hypothetical protein
VYTEIKKEAAGPKLLAKDRVAANYAAGMLVRPMVYMNTLDMSFVKGIRSGDLYGDVRNYTEFEITKIISFLMTNSFYSRQIDEKEEVTFVVITSPVIADILFNFPHYHEHIESETKSDADGKIVERSVKLTSGVKLNIITSHYNKLRDKIIMIPIRPNAPESELNFGHNWDYGTIVANYTNTMRDAAYKRVYATARELPMITNPIGVILQVINFDEIIANDPVNDILSLT